MSNLKKSKVKQKKKKSKLTPAEQFNDAIQRLDRFRKQNQRFGDELDALVKRVLPQIEPHEISKYNAYIDQATKLIPFFSKKTLPDYLRDELFHWIDELFLQITSNPFADKLDISEAEELFQLHIKQHSVNKEEKLLKKMAKVGASQEEIDQASDIIGQLRDAQSAEEFEAVRQSIFEDLSSSFDEEGAQLDPHNEDMFGEDDSFFDDMFNEYENAFENDYIPDQSHEIELKNLLKATSINKLFRRIARKIHPDLEQDETQKQIKHEQMSQLIAARDNKDIATILSMYTDTFGSLPEDMPDTDYPKLTKLISLQIEQTKDEKIDILHSKPFYAAFHDFFYSSNSKAEAKKVAKYIKDIQLDTDDAVHITQDITSIKSLRPYLEHRYANSPFMDPFMFDL